MSQNYLGQVLMFGGNFAPSGYALCNGQVLSIPQNQALFAVIGTTYGGNGIQNFALPNMQCNLTNHQGQGTGLSNYALGQTAGSGNVTLLPTNMPTHSHLLSASLGQATTGTVGGTVVPATANDGTTPLEFYAAAQSGQPALTPVALASGTCAPAGGSAPHSNLMPSLCISFVIALQGIFPSRN